MIRSLQIAGQVATYSVFAAVLGYFAQAPAYPHFPADKAQIKLSFVHGGQPKGECRERTPQELAKLAPNMRKLRVCPRERVPVTVELALDGRTLYHASLPPTGLSKDSPSHAYRRFAVEPGRHRLRLLLRDSAREQGFDYEREEEVELAPGRNLAIDFKAASGGFIIR